MGGCMSSQNDSIKIIKIRGKEYVAEKCSQCGNVHLVERENLGKAQKCQDCPTIKEPNNEPQIQYISK
jgi:uncharacterized Zn finger protein